MINEVTITAKFITGTTVQNSEQAEAQTRELLLKLLKQVHIEAGGGGVFGVEVTSVESEKI